MKRKCALLVFFLWLGNITTSLAADVSLEDARIVAQNWLGHYVMAYGSWAGSSSPYITRAELLRYQGNTLAYNFLVSPRGHIVVPSRDELPPVKLYSETTTTSMDQDSDIRDLIVDELFRVGQALDKRVQELARIDFRSTANGRLWEVFRSSEQDFSRRFNESTAAMEFLTYGPLTVTAWGQDEPYNLQTPRWFDGSRTYTGCAITAATQLMEYWNYPTTGQKATSYDWYNGADNILLSQNFALSTYDWTNMLLSYSGGSGTTEQQNAVAKLMSDVGIAFHTDYGPGGEYHQSGADCMEAATIFPYYFKYKDTLRRVDRTSYATDSDWMQVFMFETLSGRPSLLRLRDWINNVSHCVVVDGYRDSPLEQIHLNLGWADGNPPVEDEWYISNHIVTDPYIWTDVNYQAAVIGIVPKGGAAPSAASLISPSGGISTDIPTYTWTAVSNANSYYLWVDDNALCGKIRTWPRRQTSVAFSATNGF